MNWLALPTWQKDVVLAMKKATASEHGADTRAIKPFSIMRRECCQLEEERKSHQAEQPRKGGLPVARAADLSRLCHDIMQIGAEAEGQPESPSASIHDE
jgi:hypothetical protein